MISWNVAGYSGPTKELQLEEVVGLAPDAVALQEVVRGSVDFWRNGLIGEGYRVLTSEVQLLDVEGPFLPHKGHRMGRRKNLNLIAARHAITPLPGLALPNPREGFPEKYLCARLNLDGRPVDIHNVHTPPGSTTKMLKVDYWEAVLRRVDEPTNSARILCGDFNSPWSEDDEGFVTGGGRRDPEEEGRWKEAELGFLEHPELRDVYRALGDWLRRRRQCPRVDRRQPLRWRAHRGRLLARRPGGPRCHRRAVRRPERGTGSGSAKSTAASDAVR